MKTASPSLRFQPAVQRTFSWPERLLALVFGGIFFGVGSILLVTLGISPLIPCFQSWSWVETPCTIESSTIAVARPLKGTGYVPDVRFRYEWQGKTYQGTRFAWDNNIYRNRESIVKWLEPFPAGRQTVCYLSPGNPEQSVLLRSVPKPPLFAVLVTGSCVLFGLAILRGVARNRN